MVSLTLREVRRLVQCDMDDPNARCFLPSMVVIASTSQALRVFSFQDRPSITGSTYKRGNPKYVLMLWSTADCLC